MGKRNGGAFEISMAGIDHGTADISVRERFGFDSAKTRELVSAIAENPRVSGCAILSTCNRTEIYISHQDSFLPEPDMLLCDAAKIPPPRPAFKVLRGENAAYHLAEVACGLHSLIWGEDQIISQVRDAARLSRELGCTDALLETVFRTCVSAGKEVKSTVRLEGVASSAAECAVNMLSRLSNGLENRRAVVIGNGAIGRLAAHLLSQRGCAVTVTLRTYKHGETVVPHGCSVVDYERRFEAVDGADILLSATTSPHFTVRLEDYARLSNPPRLVADLAVPRDVEPAVGELDGVTLINVDSLGQAFENRETPVEVPEIIARHMARLRQWRSHSAFLSDTPRFPLFVDLSGRRVVVVGGGTVAVRRIKTLLGFGADVLVVSPELNEKPEGIEWLPRKYERGDLDGAYLAVAATSDRAVNRAVGIDATALGIPVSVSDRREECTFYFPAISVGSGIIAGVVGNGSDHKKTVRAARAVRAVLEDLS